MTKARAVLVLMKMLDRLEEKTPYVRAKETISWQDWHASRINALKLGIETILEKREQDSHRQDITRYRTCA